MMFGHVETIEDRIEHLQRIRDQQDRSGGFTAFICWTFQPQHTVLKVKHPTGVAEYLRTQALARIFLDNIDNVQSSWVTQGPGIGQVALKYGANDFGSVMMEENVVSSAGTTFRLNAAEIESLIRDAGYEPRRRNNCVRACELRTAAELSMDKPPASAENLALTIAFFFSDIAACPASVRCAGLRFLTYETFFWMDAPCSPL